MGGIYTFVKYKTNSLISIENTSFTSIIDFLVAPKITDIFQPSVLDIKNADILRRPMLANPFFDSPGKIDLFIRGERFLND